MNSHTDYDANNLLYDAWITKLITLRDQLIPTATSAKFSTQKPWIADRGFNEESNTLVGTTDREA